MSYTCSFFHFHLLTLVLMALAAGEVIWLNTIKRTNPKYMESANRERMILLESACPFELWLAGRPHRSSALLICDERLPRFWHSLDQLIEMVGSCR